MFDSFFFGVCLLKKIAQIVLLLRYLWLSPQELVEEFTMEKTYIKFLNQKRSEYLEAQKQSALKATSPGTDDLQAHLVDRLERLLNSLPDNELTLPRPLEWFRIRLRGRGGKGAHPGELGASLRKLGWTRKRSWRENEAGFRSLWFPPT